MPVFFLFDPVQNAQRSNKEDGKVEFSIGA